MPSAKRSGEYPKRVRVVYADGAEEMGTAVDPTHVDVGPMGLQLKLREVVEVDGVRRLVTGFGKKPGRDGHEGEMKLPSEERAVRLRLRPL